MRIQPPKNKKKYVGKIAKPEITLDYIGSHRFIFNDGKEISVREYIERDDELDNYEHRELFLTMWPYEIVDLARWATIKIRKDLEMTSNSKDSVDHIVGSNKMVEE